MGGPTINDIRYWHHHMARLLAMGDSLQKVAEALGKSYHRVWMLSKDPMMLELVAEYYAEFDSTSRRKQIIQTHEEITHMAAQVKVLALAELRDRIEENPAGIPTKVILEIFGSTADRTGHGKVATQVNVSSMDVRLELCNQRSDKVRLPAEVIELRAQPGVPALSLRALPSAGEQREVGSSPQPPVRLRRI
jgi:hypothetical protein